MPKEMTHILIAEAVLEQTLISLDNRQFSEILEQGADYYRFGALIHDIAFFAPPGLKGDIIKKKGMSVHGKENHNTLSPLKHLAKACDKTEKPEILALFAGSLTHYFADALFHPFVNYYSAGDISRHYRLETLMDIWFFHYYKRFKKRSCDPRLITETLKGEEDLVAELLAGFLSLNTELLPALNKTIRLHRFFLKCFRSETASLIYSMISSLAGPKAKSKRELFYPSRIKSATSYIDEKFFYRHPVTGEEKNEGLKEIAERTIRKALTLFEEMAVAHESKRLYSWCSGLKPISLETGLDINEKQDLSYHDLNTPIDRLVSFV